MRRLTTGVMCAALLCCSAESPAEAGVFPDAYNFFFGPPGTGYYTSYYGPTYGAYYAPSYSAYYGGGYTYSVGYGGACCRPVYLSYSVPSCDPCSPCRAACAPCDVTRGSSTPGDDDWNAAPGSGGAPRTYKEEDPGAPPEDLRDPAGPPGGREPGGAGPDGSEFETPAGGPDAAERDTLKPATPVPQRGADGAPITDPEEGSTTPPAEKKAEEPETKEAPPATNEELFFPQLPFDEKVTWRAQPQQHKRLVIRSRFPTPGIPRARVNPNAEWVPVSSETKLVRK